jgi:Rps23 Pro-64 3,4-dihydroxylase Tpa1-like proline 4-hydroxylase
MAKSAPVIDAICRIVGEPRIVPKEIFISNYGKDDFLSIHHDIGKGDISATFSLTEDWNPAWGGVLHFCDASRNIYKSISSQFGSLNIFKLDENAGLDHFVSTVSVNRNRYTLTAWYSVESP